MRKRASKPGGLRKVRLVTANAMPLLREAGCLIEGEPEAVFGYMDRDGNPRRVLARWAKGWRVDLRLHVGGTWSITQSLRVKITGKEEVAD